MTGQDSGPRYGAYAWYVAIILTLANSFAFVDRQVLALLVEPLKADLGVSDTVISLLYGFSFSLFYVAIGLPMARFADRSNRRNIIVASIVVWSVMTAVCGLARSAGMLFLARVGVGAGEAGLTPSAQSILADYFPRDRLPAALGIFSMGIYIGGGMALMLGGLVIQSLSDMGAITLPLIGTIKPWQATFLIVGTPGVLLGLVALTIREPARRGVVGKPVSLPFAEMARHVKASLGSYVGIIIGLSLMILVGQGSTAWLPAFFERRYGWTSTEIGFNYGLVVFFCGMAGTLSGGFVASALRRRGHLRANLIAATFGFAVLVPLTIVFPMMPTGQSALTTIGVMIFFAGFPFGGGYAALQEITPNRMRAQIAACYMLGVNLIGAGLGPTAIALATDHIFGDPMALPKSLTLVAAVASPLALAFIALALVRHPAAIARLEAAERAEAATETHHV
jgi:MFS family permease